MVQLGHQMMAADVNNDGIDDLVIGAPFAGTSETPYNPHQGLVLVFFSGKSDQIAKKWYEADIILKSPSVDTYQYFGYAMAFHRDAGILAISEPGYRYGSEAERIGRIHVYHLKANRGRAYDLTPTLCIEGETSGTIFGAGLSFHSDADGLHLAVTASGSSKDTSELPALVLQFEMNPSDTFKDKKPWHRGSMRLYSIPSHADSKSPILLRWNAATSSFFGSSNGAHLGYPNGMASDPDHNGVWLSEPWASNGRGRLWFRYGNQLQRGHCFEMYHGSPKVG